MQRRRRATAARQNEGLERLQALVHGVDLALQPVDLRLRDAEPLVEGAGPAEVRAEVEEIVLDARQHGIRLAPGLKAREADRGVRLVHRAVGLDTGVVLLDPRAAAERGLPRVAAAGVDLREADHPGYFWTTNTSSASSAMAAN